MKTQRLAEMNPDLFINDRFYRHQTAHDAAGHLSSNIGRVLRRIPAQPRIASTRNLCANLPRPILQRLGQVWWSDLRLTSQVGDGAGEL